MRSSHRRATKRSSAATTKPPARARIKIKLPTSLAAAKPLLPTRAKDLRKLLQLYVETGEWALGQLEWQAMQVTPPRTYQISTWLEILNALQESIVYFLLSKLCLLLFADCGSPQ